jgi:hypothetical protein
LFISGRSICAILRSALIERSGEKTKTVVVAKWGMDFELDRGSHNICVQDFPIKPIMVIPAALL